VTALSSDSNALLFLSVANRFLPQEQGKHHHGEERGNVETKAIEVSLLGLEGDPRIVMGTWKNSKRTYFHDNL